MKKIFTLFFLLVLGFISHAQFTAGNLVVFRVGDGSTALSAAAAPAFLDEYTPAGVLVQSVPLPTVVSGANKRVTVAGSATSEGMITRSPNGQYLVVTGYDADVATAALAATTSAAVNRVVALVDYNEIINSSTALTDAYSGSNIRSAVTNNGTNFWMSGNSSPSGTGGVRYATVGSTTSSQVSSSSNNTRAIDIFNNQLYVSSQSGAFRLATVGTGLPTGSGETLTNLPGFPTATGSPYQFYFVDIDAGVPGYDVVYVADDGSGTGIQKYSLVSGNWVSNGNIAVTANSARGLVATVSGSTVTLYTSTSNFIYSLVDNSGYNATITGTPTQLVAATTNTGFRGIEFSPVSILPLNLVSFTATLSDNKVNVNWSTANEVNVAGYEVQRSVNGKDFMPISMVNAENTGATKNYSYVDPKAVAGVSYYRLKMNDQNGSYKYSQIATIKTSVVGVSVYPNPVRSALTIQHESADKGASVSIIGMNGKQLLTVNVQAGAVQTTIEAAKLAPGSYLVVYVNNGQRQTKQFIKE